MKRDFKNHAKKPLIWSNRYCESSNRLVGPISVIERPGEWPGDLADEPGQALKDIPG